MLQDVLKISGVATVAEKKSSLHTKSQPPPEYQVVGPLRGRFMSVYMFIMLDVDVVIKAMVSNEFFSEIVWMKGISQLY